MLSYLNENDRISNDNFVNNNNAPMTTGTRSCLTRSRSSNEDELRKINDNNNAINNRFIHESTPKYIKKSSPRRSSLTSPGHHQLRRNCLVRSYNNLNSQEKNKPANLKRVSFGSSKGSMVETLIYDHHDEDTVSCVNNYEKSKPSLNYQPPLHHLHYPPRRNGYYRANILANGHANKSPLRVSTPEEETASSKGEIEPSLKPAKVKVTFLESQKPDIVSTPESPSSVFDLNVPLIMSTPTPVETSALRQGSIDSGNENPFRPDGELSKEADSIVELIKEGKPITPTKGDGVQENGINATDGGTVQEDLIMPTQANSVESAKPGTNGTTPQTITVEPGSVDVQHAVVSPPGEPTQVEHVNIKKKPKCKCCVIQ